MFPGVYISDRGPQFTADSWRELWRLTGTKLSYSSAYHPQTQGGGRANERGCESDTSLSDSRNE